MTETAVQDSAGAAAALEAERACAVLEQFSVRSGLPFDRLRALRTVLESVVAIPGEGATVWARRLIECGESLDIRIRPVAGTLAELVELVAGGLAIAVPLADSGGQVSWLVVERFRGRRVHVLDTASGQHRWMSARRLGRRLAWSGQPARTQWLVAQNPLLGSPGDSSGKTKPKPLERLLSLARPDAGDIATIFVFSLVVGLLSLTTPVAVEALVNTVAFGRYLQPVIVLALMLMTLLTFDSALRLMKLFVVELLQRRLFVRMAEDVAWRMPRVVQSAADDYHLPELVNRFFDIVAIQKITPKILIDALSAVIQMLVGMTVLAFYHPFLLGYDVALIFLMLFALFVLGRGAVRTAIKESKLKYETAAWLQEVARHPTAFRLNGGSQFALERADHLVVQWLQARQAHFRIVYRQFGAILVVYVLAAATLLGLGGWLVIRGQLTLGQLVAAELIVMLVIGSFSKLGKQLEGFFDLLAGADKLGSLLDLPMEAHERLFHQESGGPGRLGFRSIRAGWEGNELGIELDAEIESGQAIAIVDDPTIGRSVIVDLVTGARQPDSGVLQLDGVPVAELRPDMLRDQIGVARGIEVFVGTVDENIHLGRPGVTSADIREALALAAPAGEERGQDLPLNLELQTGGHPLTARQCLRLMLARAVAGKPRILLVDGTLDGLPEADAAAILERIRHLQGTTTLLITNRSSLAAMCGRTVKAGGPGGLGSGAEP